MKKKYIFKILLNFRLVYSILIPTEKSHFQLKYKFVFYCALILKNNLKKFYMIQLNNYNPIGELF